MTPVIWLFIVFAIIVTAMLQVTPFGRRIYAVGDSPGVANLSGVNVRATLTGAYMISGVCSAIVGVLLVGYNGQASLGMGDDYLLPSIAVVVAGGAVITGGKGHYLGMVGGVLLLTALQILLRGTPLPLRFEASSRASGRSARSLPCGRTSLHQCIAIWPHRPGQGLEL